MPDVPSILFQQARREPEVLRKNSGVKEEVEGRHLLVRKAEERALNRKKSFLQAIFRRNSKDKSSSEGNDNYIIIEIN